jgi:hypothetical protein
MMLTGFKGRQCTGLWQAALRHRGATVLQCNGCTLSTRAQFDTVLSSSS